MSFVAVAVGGIVLGGTLGYIGSQNSAEAQENAAMAQLEEQRKARELAMKYAEASPAELAMIEQNSRYALENLNKQLAAIEKDQALLDSVDPALKEAGKQAHQLLLGKEAAALSPLRNERARQREMLESELRAQMGSGYSTSSAGREALNRFDAETSMVMSNAQNQTMGALLGTAAAVRPDIAGKVGRAYGTTSDILGRSISATGSLKNRMISAINQTPITMAGAPWVSEAASGQNLANLGGTIGQVGGMAAGYGMTKQFYSDLYKETGRMPSGVGQLGWDRPMTLDYSPKYLK